MSGENNASGGITIDPKYLTLGIFLIGQLGAAIWWASDKQTRLDGLQADLDKLTQHMDKQLDRMEAKIDKIKEAR